MAAAAVVTALTSAGVLAVTAAPAHACHGIVYANVERLADGYTVEVTAINNASGITIGATAGTAAISDTSWTVGDDPLTATVTDLSPGQNSTVTINAAIAGSTPACTSFTSSALAAAEAPTFGDPESTETGFTFEITNYDADRYTYEFEVTDGGTATVDADGLVTVSDLDPATEATVTVTVTATEGSGYAGTASATRTGESLTPAPPDAPAKPTVVAGDSAVAVTWSEPATNGATITGYTATAEPGGGTCTAPADATTCLIGGLSNGTEYTVQVVAGSTAGDSAPSPASDGATPAAVADKDLTIDRPTVTVRGTVTLVAEGYEAGAEVTFTLFSTPVVLGTALANGGGVARLTVALPSGFEGLHSVRALGIGANGQPLSQDIAVTIVTGGVGGALPRTGPAASLGLAAALLLLGAALVGVSARRRRDLF